jgi:hypothetical protein
MRRMESRARWMLMPLSLAMATALIVIGCGGKSTALERRAETVEEAMEDLPDWYQSPPSDAEHLYGMGAGESQDMQMAVNKAEQNARVQITQNIESKVSALFKQFSEETGAGEDAEYIAMATNVSKTVASEIIGGTRIKDQKIVPESGRYRAYVLMEMAIGEAAARLQSQIQANQRVYTRFRASQGYQDLAEEVEAFEKFKKEEAAEAAGSGVQ